MKKKRLKTKAIHAYVWPVDYEKFARSLAAREKIEKKPMGITAFIEEAMQTHIKKWLK